MNTIEAKVQEYLVSHGIYPFSVLYMKNLGSLKISFHLPSDIQEFLELSGHSKVCDNFGYKVYQDTVLLAGTYLSNFLRDVGCEEMS